MNVKRSSILILVVAAGLAGMGAGPATRPSGVSRGEDANKMLDDLLRTEAGKAHPLQPQAPETDKIDRAATRESVAPKAPNVLLKREGDLISHRVGHVQRSPDGQEWTFHFEGDGKTMEEPPMILLPNLKLTMIETALHDANRDLRFTVTGMITEYNGRNYLLVEKFKVEPDETRP